MLIRALGCSGAIAQGYKTTAFLIDEDVLVDAGTGVGDLTLEELARIEHIFISHSHLDHVLAIGLLCDSVLRHRQASGRPAIQVYALEATLCALREHIFNGVIWPDFTRLPSAQKPVIQLVPITHGQCLNLDGRCIEVLIANHTVPACGFAVKSEEGWWVYSGDTGPNPALWQRLRAIKVRHLVIETAFSNEEHQLARSSRHLCPTTLGQELAQLTGPLNASVQVYITHIKPGEIESVMTEIAALSTPHDVRPLAAGLSFTLRSFGETALAERQQ